MCSVAQSSLTLCDPMECSSPGSSVHGILQPRILEWVATPFSRESSQPGDHACASCISGIARGLFATETPGKPQAGGLGQVKLHPGITSCGRGGVSSRFQSQRVISGVLRGSSRRGCPHRTRRGAVELSFQNCQPLKPQN